MAYINLILKRIFSSLLTLIFVSAILWLVLEILPGDVATRILGRDATEESLALLTEKMGLNEPSLKRYFLWIFNLLQGDLGYSLISTRPLSEILAPKIFNTLVLSSCAFLLYLPLTFITALVQAANKNQKIDNILSIIISMLCVL